MKLMIRLLALAALLAALPAFAQTYDWSSIGSTGVYDFASAFGDVYQWPGVRGA